LGVTSSTHSGRVRELIEPPLDHAAHDHDAAYRHCQPRLVQERERDVGQRPDRQDRDLARTPQDRLDEQVDRVRQRLRLRLIRIGREQPLTLETGPRERIPVKKRPIRTSPDRDIRAAGDGEDGADHARPQRCVDVDRGDGLQVDVREAQEQGQGHDVVHVRSNVCVQDDHLPVRVHELLPHYQVSPL
jgi:hypothetical protein